MLALSITDMSGLVRYGVKGPEAANWLIRHKVAVPTKANTWLIKENTIVMRLGASEFLVEDQKDAETCTKLVVDHLRVAGVYKVPRVDASYLLAGSHVKNMLSELCALDLSEHALPDNGVVMTQVAGISATILRQSLNGELIYRLWCDGTYGTYMKHTLLEITAELNRL
jgi:sarcosine oxidase subunit gamma